MKLIVEQEPIIKAKMDMEKFEAHFREHFILKDAVKISLKVEKNDVMSEHDAVEVIFNGIDWGTILQLFHTKKQYEMRIYVCNTTLEGFTMYKPEETTIGTGEFKFKSIEHNGQEMIVVHSFVPLFEHHVEKMLQDMVLDYGHDTWKKVYEM